jgi:hypothetical protein
MPRPRGGDRVEEPGDGTVVLLSRHAKPWSTREEPGGRALPRAGSAVSWDDVLYEVLRIEPRESGGFRHVLAPWDESQIVRSFAEYGAQGTSEAPEPASRWERLPAPVRALAPGFVAAVFLGWLFPFHLMGEGFSFLVHELGHTLTAWLFGCTALPAIVLTIAFAQVVAAAVLIWGLIGYAAWRWRRVPRWNAGLAAAVAFYPFLAFTKAYLTAFDLGGHLAELLVAVLALRRALDPDRSEWERPVWSFLGFYLAARNARLFGGVALSASARTDYLTIAITGQNDLVKVAATTGIRLETLSAFTAFLFVAIPLAALLLMLAPWSTSRRSSERPSRAG